MLSNTGLKELLGNSASSLEMLKPKVDHIVRYKLIKCLDQNRKKLWDQDLLGN